MISLVSKFSFENINYIYSSPLRYIKKNNN